MCLDDSRRVAVRVVLRRGLEILLVRRSAGSNCGLWEIPGGVAEFLEDTVAALKREIREETGFLIYPSKTASLTTVKDSCYITLVFICSMFRRAQSNEEDVVISPEHDDYRWAGIEEALDMDLTPTTRAVMEFLLE